MLAPNKNPPGPRLTSHQPECQDLGGGSLPQPSILQEDLYLPKIPVCAQCGTHFHRIFVRPAALYIRVANTYQLPQDSPLIPLPHSMTGPNLILNAQYYTITYNTMKYNTNTTEYSIQ